MSDAKKLEECVERILRENHPKLKDSLQHVLERIAGEFWAAELIPGNVYSNMGTMGVNKSAHTKNLLEACCVSLVQSPRKNFPKFIEILKGYGTMKELAADMESEFQQAQQVLNDKPGVHPKPVHKGLNPQQDLPQDETDCPAPKRRQEMQQLGQQGNESAKPVYTYPMESNPHGQAVIFNFVGETGNLEHFPEGSWKSVRKFEDTFRSLGYDVWRQPFLSEVEMIKRLTENIKEKDDSFVCCILAHGLKGTIDAKGGEVEIKDLQKEVGENCQKLRGKPKIFIVQACRGRELDHAMIASEDDKAENEGEDEALSAQLSREADFYVAYSTTEGHISTINDRDGCRYLNKLCDVFKERAAHLTLDEMVMEVHHELKGVVSKVTDKGKPMGKHIQMGQVVHTLRGPVRFK